MRSIAGPWLGLAFVLLCGCSVGSFAGDTANGGQDTDTALDDTADTDTGLPDAERFRVSGTLELEAGVLVGGELQFSLYSEGPERMIVCSQTQIIGAAAEMPSPDAQWVFHYAEVELEPAQEACAADLPSTLRLGLGALFPEIVPHLDAYDVTPDNLQGFYLAADAPWAAGLSADPYAMGYGATQAQLDGEQIAATGAPMPDGSYSVQAVFLLAIE